MSFIHLCILFIVILPNTTTNFLELKFLIFLLHVTIDTQIELDSTVVIKQIINKIYNTVY